MRGTSGWLLWVALGICGAAGSTDSIVRADDPPPGFTLRRHQISAEGEHLVFSDGLSSVSVYVEPLGAIPAREATTRAGAVHARVLRMGGHRVFVIGKVPAGTVERFARSVVPVAAPAAAPGG